MKCPSCESVEFECAKCADRPPPPLSQADVEVWLERSFHAYETLILNERSDGGCSHSPETDPPKVCWQCRERMYVLALLPVVKAIADGRTPREGPDDDDEGIVDPMDEDEGEEC